MNLKLMTFASIFSGLLVLTALIVVFFILQASSSYHDFPFNVSGGTLIEIK